jgi:pimeloyl-ACP methyl ester carboxylesterase
MNDTRFLEVPGGTIAYEIAGDGPLVVLSPGLADTRASYRFLLPLLVDAGYRVAAVDLRGHGDSSTGWDTYTRTDTANDLLAVVRHLGGPATIVGQSFAGGSATIAAATAPDLVDAIVEIGPFTRAPKMSLGALLRNDHNYRRGSLLLGRYLLRGNPDTWATYLDVAYPGVKPADWDPWLASVVAKLREPGRTEAALGMVKAKPADAAAKLGDVTVPALIVMGDVDSDFADPAAEATGITEAMVQTTARAEMIAGAGHYPHAQFPAEVAAVVLPFLAEVARA